MRGGGGFEEGRTLWIIFCSPCGAMWSAHCCWQWRVGYVLASSEEWRRRVSMSDIVGCHGDHDDGVEGRQDELTAFEIPAKQTQRHEHGWA